MAFDGPLQDPVHEKRARALMNEIRCVACENEPISQSNADIAEDMRDRVREMIGSGASDIEVRTWFSDRYGEFVLFRPSTAGTSGILLWGVPFGLLLLGAFGLGLAKRFSGVPETIEAIPPEAYDPVPGSPPPIADTAPIDIEPNDPDHDPAHDIDTQS